MPLASICTTNITSQLGTDLNYLTHLYIGTHVYYVYTRGTL